jgi:hypothetical protein
MHAFILKQVNCRCQVWPIPKTTAEKPKKAKYIGEYKFHTLTPLRLENKEPTIFLYGQGEFDPLIQVHTLNIIGSYNMQTTTNWLNLC